MTGGSAPWQWMGTPAVAKYLGVSHRTVYMLIDTGQIPGFQLGRVIRCRKHEVDDYIERSRIQQGDLAHRHQYMGKDAWRWTSTDEKAMRARIDRFIAACAAGEPAPCPLCEELVGQVDLARHMLGHA